MNKEKCGGCRYIVKAGPDISFCRCNSFFEWDYIKNKVYHYWKNTEDVLQAECDYQERLLIKLKRKVREWRMY